MYNHYEFCINKSDENRILSTFPYFRVNFQYNKSTQNKVKQQQLNITGKHQFCTENIVTVY